MTTTQFPASRSLRALIFMLLLAPILLGGCLETRAGKKEVEEKQVLRKQVASLQQTSADVNSRFMDLEDESRRLNGRLEALELKLQQATTRMDKGSSTVDGKLKEKDDAYREEFAKMAASINQLRADVSSLQEEQRRMALVKAEAASQKQKSQEAASAKGPYASAEEMFEQKKWKEAILEYEKYRKANPKGKQFSTATYKIGVSFQELGLRDEAKAFYEEVIAKFPKSKDAERAASRMKNLKK
jgi:tetratricopeptide (TPR) repeat protein